MNNTNTPQYWINKLAMTPHIEGGAFAEVYRSPLLLPREVLSQQHGGDRPAMTHIYFLLQRGQFSAFHRIASDELWHFYDGDPLEVVEIKPDGTLLTHLLGITDGAHPYLVITAGSWFGSRVASGSAYTLCGCTVAPGFDFADFELADRETLSNLFPVHSGVIAELTRTE